MGEETRPLVSVIIVNYNGGHLLQSCLDSVYSQSCKDIEVILVDNGSKDNSVEYVKDLFADVKIISLPENMGFAGGNIEGLKQGRGDYIMLLNNDVEVEKDCIANLLSAIEGDSSVGICASKMIAFGTNVIDSAGDGYATSLRGFKRSEGEEDFAYARQEYVFGACAGAALYRRKMLDEVGFFDEDFFLIHEDTDLNFRAQLAGWKVLYVPSAIVYHKVRSSIGHMSDSAVYFSLRNSEFVRIKNIPLALFLRCLPLYAVGTILDFLYFSVKHRKPLLYLKAKIDAVKMMKMMLGKRRKIMKMKKVDNKYLYRIMTSVWNREFFSAKVRKFFQG